ncbi:hypothetical protein JKF63_02847 [Porcisia hertigi]|uniref:Uncharacterized protein n=1 Tax=Porcisia hertigi TaxID=2761500 RepID=A0A836L4K1_9TRYP|nr:hypothetical protein JKF63_02847 [Porcisia hertigi]
MSFLRPTASSLRRAVSGVQEEQHRRGGPSAAADIAPALGTESILHKVAPSDYSHVQSRVDTGLRSRLRTSSLTRRPTASTVPCSPSLREFADKCDSVIQRAHEVLERTREQELKVTKALEERQSQSPARHGTPPPQRESAPQQTPAKQQHCLVSPWSSPAMPNAPPSTPLAPTSAAPSTYVTTSPPLRPPPASPPTLVGLVRSPLPTQPDTDEGRSDLISHSSSLSLLDRLRRSWQRASGEAGEAPATSPTPSAVGEALCASAARVSPRKSVRFASPDKLETVTPTKVVALWSDSDEDGDEGDEEETSEDEEEQDWLPPSKKTHVESNGSSQTPLNDSVVLPPAPPPSAVKTGSRSCSGTSDSSRTAGSLSSSHSSASPPPSPKQLTRSPSLTRTSWSPQRGGIGGGSRSASRSSTSSSRPPMDHDEVKEYVTHHTIRRSLSRISRADMEDYLREEGIALPAEGHWLKRYLLAQIRSLIKQELAPQ